MRMISENIWSIGWKILFLDESVENSIKVWVGRWEVSV